MFNINESYFFIDWSNIKLEHHPNSRVVRAESQFKDIITKGEQNAALMDEDAKIKNKFGADQSAAEQAQKYLLLLRLKKSDSQAVL